MTKMRKRGLGRGLDAIFKDTSSEKDRTVETITDISGQKGTEPKTESSALADQKSQARITGLRMIAVSQLVSGQFQPRTHFDPGTLQDLASSIRNKGILEPLIVRTTEGGAYEIIAGERRWRAAQIAQLHEVPVIVKVLSDVEALEIALIENIQREDLSPLEEARAYDQLLSQFAYTQENLAEVLGRSRSHVANMLRLLKLPKEVHSMVENGKLTAGHARALIMSESAEKLAVDVVRKGLNVRQTEKLVADAQRSGNSQRPSRTKVKANKDADTRALEATLTDAIGMNITVNYKNDGSGAITIFYKNMDQLDEVCRRIQRQQ